ncbi:A/G-specific adenine glycosylase [bacterium 210820-DFI.6.37]|nr:A/G-specific adenine glycosylase [bacterium 210820-DFI.6.37]
MEREDQIYRLLPKRLIPWYRENARDLPWRRDKDPYHVWISEIMLQQTRVAAVKEYYIRFLKELPDIRALAEVEEGKLLKLWEGLGYYNRARNLRKAAKKIVCENNGVFPSEYSEILTLPGIGEYTAGAVASVCFDEAVAAVDGNVLRILSRITESYDDILKASTKKQAKRRLEAVYPKEDCGDFTQSLMELGATVCGPSGKPKCQSCPVEDICVAHAKGIETSLPVKITKKNRRVEERTVFVLRRGDKVAARKRETEGLLAGMWEFPNVLGKLTAEEALETADRWGCGPALLEREIFRKHIFSHVQWDMTCFYIQCLKETEQLEWVSGKALSERMALPTAFRQFWDGILPEKD